MQSDSIKALSPSEQSATRRLPLCLMLGFILATLSFALAGHYRQTQDESRRRTEQEERMYQYDAATHASAPGELPTGVTLAGYSEAQNDGMVVLCQAIGPAAPCPVRGVDCNGCNACRRLNWRAAREIDWQAFAQGEYVGHARMQHVPEYRIRVDDELEIVYRITREEIDHPYQLGVGDEVRIESITDKDINRDTFVLPDGTITLRLLGSVRASGKTVTQLRDELELAYTKYYKVPSISVTPLKVNSKLEDLRASSDARQGAGGQVRRVTVTPEGTISLPAVGIVFVQGLSLPEVRDELNMRYAEEIQGMEVTPILVQRAPRNVFIVGEVKNPGRYRLEGPTTLMQAIGMAGSWNVGANLNQVVVFRRGDDWRLMAAMLDLRQALLGKEPCPDGEIWLNDSDLIIVPKSNIVLLDNFIELVFTKGIYGVVPFSTSISFTNLSALGGGN